MKTLDVEISKLRIIKQDNAFASSGISLAMTYHHAMSAMYLQCFIIKMFDVPDWVRNYFRDGKVIWKPTSKDRCNVLLNVNSVQLIRLGRSLLCNQVHPYVHELMKTIQSVLAGKDNALAVRLVPDCVYRGGHCFKTKMDGCGMFPIADINHYQKIAKKGEQNV